MEHVFKARSYTFPVGERTLVMGIVNVTPDSFSDGGTFAKVEDALRQAENLIRERADCLDIGAESTRPDSHPVTAEEELSRLRPVLAKLSPDWPVSIDTSKAVIAKAALEAGACIVNDVWGLQHDPDLASVVADFQAGIVMMHRRETVDPSLDIVAEICRFLDRSIAIAAKAGIREDSMMIDPGIGFGKTFEQNLTVLARLGDIKRRLGLPLLLGTSRKSFIARLYPAEPKDRLPGTLASGVLGAIAGADMLRVHDVGAHVQALRVADAILRTT